MNNKLDYRENYNVKDSSNIFLLSILLPTIVATFLMLVVKMIFPNINNTLYFYLSLSLNQIVFLLTYFIYNKQTKTNFIKASNIKFNLNFLQIIIIIVIGLIAMYGFTMLVDYIAYLLSLMGYKSSSFSGLNLSNIGYLFLNLILVAFLPCVCEELMFRGIALNGLKKFGPILMIVISSAMFSIMHLNIEQTIYQFVLGGVMASIVMITGSIFSSMILHFFNNALILIVSYITMKVSPTVETTPWVPKNVFQHILPFLLAILSLALIFLLLCVLRKITKKPMYDIFNLQKKSKNIVKENIDINDAEIINTDIINEESLNNTENTDKNDDEMITKQDNKDDVNLVELTNNKNKLDREENTRLIISLSFGSLLWILFAIMSFMV